MTQSPLARAFRYVNSIIALVILVAAGIFYWFLWRPRPQRSGSLDAAVSAPVNVAFDRLGVPHIRAENLEDALYTQGYLTAQDRLWQMDVLRRLDGGDLAEIVGPAALESDKESRRLRLRRIAEEAYITLPAGDRAAFAAYVRGVNAFIATHRGSLPLEFTLLRYQPLPWSVVDSLLICLHMFRDLTTNWRDELNKRNMLADGDADKVNYLFPVRSGSDVQPGSNAWAIAGRHTASGKPLLSNDMHLAYSMPGIWYMAHLEAPGLDVSGVTLPGTPGVIVGHNQRIAWGITNLQFDVQDLYIEKIDERTGRYEFQGHVEQARPEREVIRVKGQAPVEVTTWVTRHGQLFASEGADRMALRWSVAVPGVVQFPILDINRAQNWEQFTAALSRFPGPGSNFVYADVDGNIGYHAAGKLPKRRGYSGDVPVNGASGEFDWDGFIPFDEMPSVYNPASGLIVTANQNPFPADFPYPINGNFAPPYRAHRIRDLLSAHDGWRAPDLLPVQTDITSEFNRFLANQIVAAYRKRNASNPGLDPAVAMLSEWNGQMQADQAAPFLIMLAYQHLRSSVAERAAPVKGGTYEFSMSPVVLEQLLRDRPAGWFDDYDSLLLRTLADAVEEGTRIQGRDLRHWKYGAWMRVTINHPILHPGLDPLLRYVPLVGPWIMSYFDVGTVPMSGSSTTVKQTTRTLAPSMRMDADLSDWDRSLLNVQIGQSGVPFTAHYKDEWLDYYNGRSFPMQFREVVADSTLVFRPAGR